MRAEDLTLDGLVSFSRGKLELHGRRLIIHDLYALAQFRRDLIQMVGWEQARRILTRLGFFWGQADAAAMQRLFHWDNVTELLKAGAMLQMLQGVARTELKILRMDEPAGQYWLEFVWHDSGEAEACVSEAGPSEQPSCWKLIGYASGYTSFCLGKSIYFIEQKCRVKGDPLCLAVGKDIDSWGAEISGHLPYFQSADIKGKIIRLSERLKEKEFELARERAQLEKALAGPNIFPVEVRNQRFIHILNLASRVAKFDSSVLITGETGVGKEVLARLIHQISTRSEGPFITVNCLAMPETLCESELFGHKAGSFTSASRDQCGLIEEGDGGTVFLDEIGDISPNLQMKLLRVLQEHEILRIGETRPRKVDVRIIAATNRNLEQKVAERTFREDLYYRLKVVSLELPSLRERPEDILPLARHFVHKCAKHLELPLLRLDATCVDYLMEYAWPGNIRELENAIEHAAVLCTDNLILPEHLPSTITKKMTAQISGAQLVKSLDAIENEHIRRVLELTGGHREKTAEILGISVATLYRKLKLLRQEKESDLPTAQSVFARE